MSNPAKAKFQSSFNQLKSYCETQDFKGWDPYDGLNSGLFNAIPGLNKARFPRLAWIQLFKRNPINLRVFTGVKKGHNPKGLGLFITGYANLYIIDGNQEHLDRVRELSDKVIELISPGYSGACWGYNFDWQARAFFQPKGMPTVVATTFISCALMDAYDVTGDEKYLDVAYDARHFILKDLNRTPGEHGTFSLSYSPLDQTQVFNASLLGAKLISRLYGYKKEQALLDEAKKIVQYACDHQAQDGSWPYSRLPYQQWIDSFHTGYNLECIQEYVKQSGDDTFQPNLDKGLTYFLENFFTKEGIPKYYHNQTYPIDIHAPAQMIITLHRLGVMEENRALVEKVLDWTVTNMQDKKGYFYYQMKKGWSSKIPYMRWAQAWMFYAYSYYLRY